MRDVTELVAMMKANKIQALKLPDGTAIELAPDAFDAPPFEPPPAVDGPNLDERGSAGMTRRDQLELFGQVFEADFRKKV